MSIVHTSTPKSQRSEAQIQEYKSPKKSVDRVHTKPFHACVKESAIPGGHACLPAMQIITTASQRHPGAHSATQDLQNTQPGTCRAENSCTSHKYAALWSGLQRQRAATVTAYRLKLLLPAPRQSSTCREQGIRRCKSVAHGGGHFSLISAPSELGQKICQSNSGTAETMVGCFVRRSAPIVRCERSKLLNF